MLHVLIVEFITRWWIIALAVIGVISIISIIFALFSKFGRDNPNRFVKTIYPVDSQEFLEAIASLANSPIEYGEEVRILKNGIEFMPALLFAIKNARKSITFTVFWWEGGKMSDAIFEVLTEKASKGIEVRLLLDGIGGFLAPKDKLEELKKAGGKVDVFGPVRFGRFRRFHKRTHRRAIVIDGNIGFTGGAAVADKWLGNADDSKHWRDTMFEVRGNMAFGLQSAFAQLWAGTNGEILIGPKFYPDRTEAKNSNTNKFISIISSPSPNTEPLNKIAWLSIISAQSKIYITNSYMIPDKFIFKALSEKAKAGIDVRVLVPNNKTDVKPVRHATHYYYEYLLEAGIKVYEYKPTMMHSKVLLIDDKWSIIGSANMDSRSVTIDQENVIGILDPKLGKSLNTMFMEDIEKSELINIRRWKKRNLLKRILELFLINFMNQY